MTKAKSVTEGSAFPPDVDAAAGAESPSRSGQELRSARRRTTQRALPIGEKLLDGRFSILRRLGEGGMGVVYEAFDVQRDCRVALKTLTDVRTEHPESTPDDSGPTLARSDASAVYAIKNEFRAVSEVHHENLVRLHELFSWDGFWFFTMELVEGEPFDRWVRPNGSLEEKRLRSGFRSLASAVSAVHAAGRLHRDLKPSNVLVTAQGRVVVLDFGLAIEPELGGVGHTVDDATISGTPAYMAPEQLAGRPATAASDLYACGVVLFEALTGRLPFEGRPDQMFLHKLQHDAVRPSSVTTGVPEDLDALCAELLRRTPDARPTVAAVLSRAGAAGDDAPFPRPEPRLIRTPNLEIVGRERELAALEDAFAATLGDRTVMLSVSGESGIGKTALVTAFLEQLRASGRATVLMGRCYERENVPYKGFDALLDDVSRYLRRLRPDEAASLLPREVYALARIFPALDRIPVVAYAPKKDVPDPQDLKRRAFDAFAEFLARTRDRGPLVVLIDDLQWIDHDSAQFLRALLLNPNRVPVLFVCTHRTDGAGFDARLKSVLDTARSNPFFDVRSLELGPLSAAALSAIVRSLSPEIRDERVLTTLVTEAKGSPFLAAVLARGSSVWGQAEVPVETSFERVLMHVVGTLPPDCSRLLSLLALAGQPLSPRIAIDAACIATGHLALDRLREEKLARIAVTDDGERVVDCYHDRVRETVAARLGPDKTRELALGLTEALVGTAGADVELVARMQELAGMPEQAAEYLARAAERAWGALAFDRAAELFARALALGHFDSKRLRLLRIRRAEALSYSGHGERAALAFLEAVEDASNDEAHELERRAGEQHLMCGDLVRGRALLARSLDRVGISFPRTLPVAVGSATWSRARLRMRGFAFEQRNDQAATTLRQLDALRTAAHGLVRTDPLRSMDFCARWLLRALDAGHIVEIGRATAWDLLFTAMMAAPEAKLVESAARCDHINGQTGDWMSTYVTVFARGWHAMIRTGDPEDALRYFARALDVLGQNPSATSSYDRAWLESFRVMSTVLCGRIAAAGEVVHAHIEEAVSRGDFPVAANFIQAACYAAVGQGKLGPCRGLLDRAKSWLRATDETIQDFMFLSTEPLPALYEGDPLRAFHESAPHRERFLSSFVGRFMVAGLLENEACGLAAAAARHTSNARERKQLVKLARAYATRATSAKTRAGTGAPAAVLACLASDRAGAIAALEARLGEQLAPLARELTRRRLGEIIGGDRGRSIIADADRVLREGGVADPSRFTAAMVPGVELR